MQTQPSTIALNPVALADVGESGPVWNVLVLEGEHFARSANKAVRVTLDDLKAMVRNFADVVKAEGWFPIGAPIDANHNTVRGSKSAEDTKALGYITDVKLGEAPDGTPAVLGLTDWTDEGRARVRGREFQGFSVEFFPAGAARSKRTGEAIDGAVLFGGTLTNHPFVSGLPAIAASEDDTPTPAPRKERTRMKNLTAHLGLAEDAAEVSILAEVQRKDEKIAALSEQITTLEADKATTAKALDEALSQRDALQAEKDERAAADKAALLSEFVDQGRCANTDDAKSDVWAVVQALGEDKARALYPANGEFNTRATGHDGGKADEAGAKSAEVLFDESYAAALKDGKTEAEAYAFARDTHAAALAEAYRN